MRPASLDDLRTAIGTASNSVEAALLAARLLALDPGDPLGEVARGRLAAASSESLNRTVLTAMAEIEDRLAGEQLAAWIIRAQDHALLRSVHTDLDEHTLRLLNAWLDVADAMVIDEACVVALDAWLVAFPLPVPLRLRPLLVPSAASVSVAGLLIASDPGVGAYETVVVRGQAPREDLLREAASPVHFGPAWRELFYMPKRTVSGWTDYRIARALLATPASSVLLIVCRGPQPPQRVALIDGGPGPDSGGRAPSPAILRRRAARSSAHGGTLGPDGWEISLATCPRQLVWTGVVVIDWPGMLVVIQGPGSR